MRNVLVMITLLASVSCSPDGTDPVGSSVTAPAEPLAVLEAMEHDCLQYRAGTNADGDALWHADFVYFYLVDEQTGDLYIADDGLPLASGFLYHEVIGLMEVQPEIPGTAWTYRVQRIVQHVRDGQVVRSEPHVTVDDADIWALVEKNRAARANDDEVLPEARRPEG